MNRLLDRPLHRGILRASGTAMLLLPLTLGGVRADEVTDWNEHMVAAMQAAGPNPIVSSRDAALVAAAVFDAVNGIERRYEPIHVDMAAPRGASPAPPPSRPPTRSWSGGSRPRRPTWGPSEPRRSPRSATGAADSPSRGAWRGGSRSPTRSGPGGAPTGSRRRPRRSSGASSRASGARPRRRSRRGRCPSSPR